MGLETLEEIRAWILELPTARKAVKEGPFVPTRPYAVADDFLTKMYRLKARDFTTLFTGEELFEVAFASAKASLSSFCTIVYFVIDKAGLVPLRKSFEQKKRTEAGKKSKRPIRPYDKSCVITHEGIIENNVVDKIDSTRLAASRDLRRQLGQFFTEMLCQTHMPANKSIVMEFAHEGPVVVVNKVCNPNTTITHKHPFGEYDLIWANCYARDPTMDMVVESSDSDVIPVCFWLLHCMGKKAVGNIYWVRGGGTKEYWDMKQLYNGVLEDNPGWTAIAAIVACLLGGCDYLPKYVASYWVNWTNIVSAVNEHLDMVNGIQIDTTDLKNAGEEWFKLEQFATSAVGQIMHGTQELKLDSAASASLPLVAVVNDIDGDVTMMNAGENKQSSLKKNKKKKSRDDTMSSRRRIAILLKDVASRTNRKRVPPELKGKDPAEIEQIMREKADEYDRMMDERDEAAEMRKLRGTKRHAGEIEGNGDGSIASKRARKDGQLATVTPPEDDPVLAVQASLMIWCPVNWALLDDGNPIRNLPLPV